MKPFLFKYFSVQQENSAMKVGTDSMILESICDFPGRQRILDIGAGTGVLSLMIAQRFSPETITSVEIDLHAFKDLEENLASSPFSSKHIVIPGNILEQRFTQKFDGIISNPPFFEDSTKNPEKEKTTARHTDELAFNDLLAFAADNLSADGLFWIIIPHDIAGKLEKIALLTKLFLKNNIILEGKPGKPVRSILCFSPDEKSAAEASVFTIRNEDGTYTEKYIELTKEFHNTDLRKK